MGKKSAEVSPLLGREQRLPKESQSNVNMLEDESFSRETRRWRKMSAIAGGVMFALAGAGLLAIFNATQAAKTTQSSTTLQEMDEGGSGSRIERSDMSDISGHGNNNYNNNNNIISTPSKLSANDRTDAPESPEFGSRLASPAGGRGVGGDNDGASVIPGSGFVGTRKAAPKATFPKSASREKDTASASSSKPNVFFIMVDDMGWNDIGYQSTDLELMTPNLDKLAAGGIKMDQYYSMSICTPSRASLMTGRYPVRYGLQYNVIQPGAPWGLPLTEKLLPEYMNDAGYDSHMVGKWHIGSYTHAHTPQRRGFQTFLGYLNDEEMYWTHQSWTAKLHGRKFFDFGYGNQTDYYDIIDRFTQNPSEPSTSDDGSSSSSSSSTTYTGPTSSLDSSTRGYDGEYSTSVFQKRAMELIREKTPYDEEPLFLYLAHQAVHDPLGVPPLDSFTAEEISLLDELGLATLDSLRLRFAKVLLYMDKTIGELVDYLEAEGWMENSIIIVASDNGGCPSKGGNNYPLRGIKHSYWEGGNRVPAFIYSKSHIPEEIWGTTYKGMMHVTDWLPTLGSAVGFEIAGNAGPLDGVDHWDYFIGAAGDDDGAGPRTEMLYNFDTYIMWTSSDAVETPDYPLAQGAYRQGKYKLLLSEWCAGYYTFDQHILDTDPLTNPNSTCQDMGTCADCGMSCVGSANYTDWLFDIEADPREQNNLITELPELALEMHQRMTQLVFQEYTNSSYVDIDKDAYHVWAHNGWWMVPWYSLAEGSSSSSSNSTSTSDGDSSSDSSSNSSSNSSSDSNTGDGGSSDVDLTATVATSWTSSVSSSNPTQ